MIATPPTSAVPTTSARSAWDVLATGGPLLSYVGKDGDIWLAAPEGAAPSRLVASRAATEQRWSPDGQRLAILTQTGYGSPARLSLYDVASAAVVTLALNVGAPDFEAFLSRLSWSPNGRHLLLDSGAGEMRNLAVIDPDTGRLEHELGAFAYTWSPDGEQLALAQVEPLATPISLGFGDTWSLAVWTVGDAAARVVVRGTATALHRPVAWLQDGRLVYETIEWDDAAQASEESTWSLLVDGESTPAPVSSDEASLVPADRLARVPASLQSVASAPAAWSPDGQWLAYASGDGPAERIFVLDSLGAGQPRPLASGTVPRWRPARPSPAATATAPRAAP